MYKCVNIYVHMYIYMYIYIYIYIYIYTLQHTQKGTFTSAIIQRERTPPFEPYIEKESLTFWTVWFSCTYNYVYIYIFTHTHAHTRTSMYTIILMERKRAPPFEYLGVPPRYTTTYKHTYVNIYIYMYVFTWKCIHMYVYLRAFWIFGFSTTIYGNVWISSSLRAKRVHISRCLNWNQTIRQPKNQIIFLEQTNHVQWQNESRTYLALCLIEIKQ